MSVKKIDAMLILVYSSTVLNPNLHTLTKVESEKNLCLINTEKQPREAIKLYLLCPPVKTHKFCNFTLNKVNYEA